MSKIFITLIGVTLFLGIKGQCSATGNPIPSPTNKVGNLCVTSMTNTIGDLGNVTISTFPSILFSITITSVGVGASILEIFDARASTPASTLQFTLDTTARQTYDGGPFGVYFSSGIMAVHRVGNAGSAIVTYKHR